MKVEVRTNAGTELKKIAKRSGRVKNMKQVHYQISVMLDRWVKKNFQTEGGNVGGWKPFAQVCVGRGENKTCGRGRVIGSGRNRKLDTTAKLLQDTRNMSAHTNPFHSQRNAGIGTKVKYAKYHQEGIGVPERPMIPDDDMVKKDIIEKYRDHMKKSMR